MHVEKSTDSISQLLIFYLSGLRFVQDDICSGADAYGFWCNDPPHLHVNNFTTDRIILSLTLLTFPKKIIKSIY